MKIIYAINNLSKGGAERVISNLSNYTSSKNNQVYIVTFERKIEYELNNEIKVISFNSNKKMSKIYKHIKYINFLKKTFDDIKPDIILSFLPKMCLMSLMANQNNYPLIVSTRNDYRIEFPNLFYKLLMKKYYHKAFGYIFQTNDQLEYFKKIGLCKKSCIIPNPINTNFMIEPYDGKREKTIVSVGRLVKQKNQKLLIDSFANINEKYSDYKLIIYGDGILRDKLNKRINKLNMNNKIILAGKTDKIIEKIYKSSIFVLSSDFEGMPNALMEAMALGIPAISTDCPCGGPKMLIENNNNGILIKKNNKKELIDAMKKILDNPDLSKKISYNAHKKICENFNEELTYKKYFDFLKEIVKENKK